MNEIRSENVSTVKYLKNISQNMEIFSGVQVFGPDRDGMGKYYFCKKRFAKMLQICVTLKNIIICNENMIPRWIKIINHKFTMMLNYMRPEKNSCNPI